MAFPTATMSNASYLPPQLCPCNNTPCQHPPGIVHKPQTNALLGWNGQNQEDGNMSTPTQTQVNNRVNNPNNAKEGVNRNRVTVTNRVDPRQILVSAEQKNVKTSSVHSQPPRYQVPALRPNPLAAAAPQMHQAPMKTEQQRPGDRMQEAVKREEQDRQALKARHEFKENAKRNIQSGPAFQARNPLDNQVQRSQHADIVNPMATQPPVYAAGSAVAFQTNGGPVVGETGRDRSYSVDQSMMRQPMPNEARRNSSPDLANPDPGHDGGGRASLKRYLEVSDHVQVNFEWSQITRNLASSSVHPPVYVHQAQQEHGIQYQTEPPVESTYHLPVDLFIDDDDSWVLEYLDEAIGRKEPNALRAQEAEVDVYQDTRSYFPSATIGSFHESSVRHLHHEEQSQVDCNWAGKKQKTQHGAAFTTRSASAASSSYASSTTGSMSMSYTSRYSFPVSTNSGSDGRTPAIWSFANRPYEMPQKSRLERLGVKMLR